MPWQLLTGCSAVVQLVLAGWLVVRGGGGMRCVCVVRASASASACEMGGWDAGLFTRLLLCGGEMEEKDEDEEQSLNLLEVR